MTSRMTQPNNEIWRPVSGYEGLYSVSSLGRVRSEPRTVPYTDGVRKSRTVNSKILSPSNLNGYPQVALFRDNERQTVRVHRLVAEAFIPNEHNYPAVNHKDGIKSNNTPDNLEWCSILENNVHALETGLQQTGESHHNHKLSDREVEEIRSLYTGKHGEQSALARRYGVTPQCIHFIIHGKARTY